MYQYLYTNIYPSVLLSISFLSIIYKSSHNSLLFIPSNYTFIYLHHGLFQNIISIQFLTCSNFTFQYTFTIRNTSFTWSIPKFRNPPDICFLMEILLPKYIHQFQYCLLIHSPLLYVHSPIPSQYNH